LDANPSLSSAKAPDRYSFALFQAAFRDLPVIPLQEIRLRFPDMHRSRLSEWQRRGLLLKVRNGFYRLADRPMTEHERWAIANAIYTPSYVSLRTALAFHGFIPEGVFHVESVTTSKTKRFTFNGTDYSYRNMRPDFYYGYRFIEQNGVRVMMAAPEKSLLDLLYLEPDVDGPDAFEAWRLNADEIYARIDPARMDDFANAEGSRALLTRYRRLKRWLHDHTG
jgi:predicted transcriptional regulator of viral defense system